MLKGLPPNEINHSPTRSLQKLVPVYHDSFEIYHAAKRAGGVREINKSDPSTYRDVNTETEDRCAFSSHKPRLVYEPQSQSNFTNSYRLPVDCICWFAIWIQATVNIRRVLSIKPVVKQVIHISSKVELEPIPWADCSKYQSLPPFGMRYRYGKPESQRTNSYDYS